MRLKEQFRKRKDKLDSVLDITRKSLRNLPEGKLRVSRSKGYLRYYRITPDSGKNGKYIGTEGTKLIRDLAQKDYDLRVVALIEKELNCLKKYEKIMESGTYEGALDSLSDERKKLVQPVCLSDEDFVKNWLARDYKRMGFAEGEPAYDTAAGARVRSKSEALISNTLERWEVPQLYEVPMILKGYGKVCPDFLILNVRTRHEYIWEHFGMLDDPAYLENAMKKIEAYIENGYIPGINLIITFESSKHPLDLKTVNKLIETFLK